MTTATSDRARCRIPADIEKPDKILANLTARQLAILSVTVVLAYCLLTTASQLLPLPVAAMLTVPLLGAGTAVALIRRDGVGLDELLVAAWRQSRTPRRQVYAPEGITPPGHWADDLVAHQVAPAPISLPVRQVRHDGVLDLGHDGMAVLVECTTVSFALRTAEEQQALVSSFGRWLNSLSNPVQVLICAEQINLRPTIQRLHHQAPALPHPSLERAALEHAAFLTRLAASRDLLRRRVLLVLREPYIAAPRTPRDPDGTAGRVLRRAEDACRALTAAAVPARVLDAQAASAVLATSLDPDIPPGLINQAAPTDSITAAPISGSGLGVRVAPAQTDPPSGPRRSAPPQPPAYSDQEYFA